MAISITEGSAQNNLLSVLGPEVQTNLQDTARMRNEANVTKEAANAARERHQKAAGYNKAGGDKNQSLGQQTILSGTVKSITGTTEVLTGFGLIAKGSALSAATAGAGAAITAEGMTLVAKGFTGIVTGMIDQKQGQQLLAIAQQQLETATDQNMMAKGQQAVVNKARNLEQVMEFKLQALDELKNYVIGMLQKSDINTENMTEQDYIDKMQKLWEDGGKALANDNIMQVTLGGEESEGNFKDQNGDPLEGTFFYKRDEATGDFYEVQLAYEDSGNPTKDTLGGIVLDPISSAKKVEDKALKNYLSLKFSMTDFLKTFSTQLTIADFDSKENLKPVGLDTNNPEHMAYLSDLVNKTDINKINSGQMPAPLKFGVDENGEYCQQWSWSQGVPLAQKVYIKELYGYIDNLRGNIDNFLTGIELSENALATAGIKPGDKLFSLLSTTGNTGLKPLTSTNGFGIEAAPSIDSLDFAEFGGNTSILDNSTNDLLPRGLA